MSHSATATMPSSSVAEPSFKLNPHPQTSSRLMKLPAELRVKILRMLLKDADPFDTIEPHLSNDWYRKMLTRQGPSMSAQILSCCQQINVEGQAVLYGENSLVVRCMFINEDCRNSDYYCRFLDSSVLLDHAVEWMDKENFDVESLAQAKLREASIFGRDALAERMVELLPVARKFDNLYVHVECNAQDEVYMACRVLGELLAGKNVTIKAMKGKSDELVPSWWLRSCCFLRCKSVSFITHSTADTQDYVEEITGEVPVKDIHSRWHYLLHDLLNEFRTADQESFEDANEDIFDDLQDAVLNYDVDEFEKQRKLLLEKAIDCNERWAQGEPERIRQGVEDFRLAAERQIAQVEVTRRETAEELENALHEDG